MFTIPTIDMEKTGQNIVILRKKAGFTVRDLQEVFGFGTPQAIYKWQQGLALPTIDVKKVLDVNGSPYHELEDVLKHYRKIEIMDN